MISIGLTHKSRAYFLIPKILAITHSNSYLIPIRIMHVFVLSSVHIN